MKKMIIVFCLFCLVSSVNAQISRTDSLKNLLSTAKDDTTKLNLLVALVVAYTWTMPDSALIYVEEEMSLAKKMKSDYALSLALTGYGGVLSIMGNYPQAIYFELEGLKAAERSKNFLRIFWSYYYLALTYRDAGDYERALFYCYKKKSLLESRYKLSRDSTEKSAIDMLYNSYAIFDFAIIYDKLNQSDSALKYMQIVNQASIKQYGKIDVDPTHLYLFGNIYSKKGNYFKALEYYRRGYRYAVDNHNHSNVMENGNGMAKIFWKVNQPDSSIYYANRVLETSRYAQYPLIKLEALSLLADVYKSKGNIDSTVKYLELTLATKDSLFNQQKVIEMQSLTFNERLRQQDMQEAQQAYQNRIKTYILVSGLIVLLLVASILFRYNRNKQKAKVKIEKAYEELKSTQAQLIQSEKMASLGELTAGIAHEIQNPLNFVNNFSEVNTELIVELRNELANGNGQEAMMIADDIKENEQKIFHHGKRADAIVKGMLQHSRVSTGQKEPTAINALADEYLRLSYHVFRAKDKTFNAIIETNFDESIGMINVVPQDMGRVFLNLFNNAFYAVTEKKKQAGDSYEPTVSVCTKKLDGKIEIRVKDNGIGIPQKVADKIFQPFFTTKPTGQGTGLGLSLAYDISKAHGGEIKVESKAGEGSAFIVELPF
ncbi:MAG: hypothetical protein ICV51_14190 [Flavisolibacter sp.]|nr:hypothetical protein [Flavisolibacter sp.]